MRLAGVLMYAALVAVAFASGLPRTSLLWVVLVWAFVVLFMASLFRVHAVINAPKENR